MPGVASLLTFLLFAALWLAGTAVLNSKSRTSRGDDRLKYARTAVRLEIASLAVIICCLLFCLLAFRSLDVFLLSILLLSMLLLCLSIIRWRELGSEKHYQRLYEREPGFCSRCGYNLTGNVSGVCPECGWKLPDDRNHRPGEK
jgi:uncharacterized paraquat-inducible protein A